MTAPRSSAGTIGEALATAAATLREAGVDEPRANAELLLAQLLRTDRGALVALRRDPLDPAAAERYAAWVRRRATREPLQHVTGVQEFYGLEIRTDHRALVPRPETEHLVETALGLGLDEGARVVDAGTGTGCIAVALAVARPDLVVEALDVSADALDLARENATLYGVERRIRFTLGDLRRPPSDWRGAIDLVVSNPPYVSEAEWRTLEPEVRDHDPRDALVAGPTGLETYAVLVPAAFDLLRPGGHLVIELGYGQAGRVRETVARCGFDAVEVRKDLRRVDRVLVACRPRTGGAS
jgi:release factor glutamine methyltransferase